MCRTSELSCFSFRHPHQSHDKSDANSRKAQVIARGDFSLGRPDQGRLEAFSVKAELDLRGRLVPASDEDFAGVVGQMLHFNLSVTASLA
jgi:hypothetical protein